MESAAHPRAGCGAHAHCGVARVDAFRRGVLTSLDESKEDRGKDDEPYVGAERECHCVQTDRGFDKILITITQQHELQRATAVSYSADPFTDGAVELPKVAVSSASNLRPLPLSGVQKSCCPPRTGSGLHAAGSITSQ